MIQRTLLPPAGTARFSPCGLYRYELTRHIGDGGILNVIGCNPSKAGAEENDATVTRLIERAHRLGFGTLVVTNAFAFVATYFRDLKKADDPVGPENDLVILNEARRADMVLCAWGASLATYQHRGEKVRRLLTGADVPLWALQVSDNGEPWHVLYLPYSLKPSRYCWDAKGVLV